MHDQAWSLLQAVDKLGGSLRICQYHGSSRPRSERKIAEEFDLVITTYQTLASDYRQDTTSNGSGFKPLGAIDWHRIILDEVCYSLLKASFAGGSMLHVVCWCLE